MTFPNRFYATALALMMIISLVTTTQLCAQETPLLNYAVVKTGIYNPTGDLDNFDTGLNLEGAFGRYFHKNVALEGGVGLFGADAEIAGTNTLLGSYTEEDELTVMPLTFTAKGILPLDRFKLFLGAGLGVYFTDLDSRLNTSKIGNFTVNDSDIVFGAHFTAGGSYNINDRIFCGIDAKYLMTEEAEYNGTALGRTITLKGDLNGYTFNAFFGYRF